MCCWRGDVDGGDDEEWAWRVEGICSGLGRRCQRDGRESGLERGCNYPRVRYTGSQPQTWLLVLRSTVCCAAGYPAALARSSRAVSPHPSPEVASIDSREWLLSSVSPPILPQLAQRAASPHNNTNHAAPALLTWKSIFSASSTSSSSVSLSLLLSSSSTHARSFPSATPSTPSAGKSPQSPCTPPRRPFFARPRPIVAKEPKEEVMVSDQWPGMLGWERAGSVREEGPATGEERWARREVRVEVEGSGGSEFMLSCESGEDEGGRRTREEGKAVASNSNSRRPRNARRFSCSARLETE